MQRVFLNSIRLTVFAVAACLLYWQVIGHKDTRALFQQLGAAFQQAQVASLLLVLLLAGFNWAVESTKWRYLMRPIQRISFLRAFRATLAGTTLTLFTPNRTGEFVGRVLFIRDGKRVAAAVATALGSIAQLVITLVLGSLSLMVLFWTDVPLPFAGEMMGQLLIILAITITVITLLLYFHPRLFHQVLTVLPFLSRWERHFRVLMTFERGELGHVLLLSAVRYAVFTGQFVFVLWLFNVGLSLSIMVFAVPVIYLVTTLLPTVLLTELGVRGSAAVGLLAPLGGQEGGILLATFMIWTVNLLLPALIGGVILLFLRLGRGEAGSE